MKKTYSYALGAFALSVGTTLAFYSPIIAQPKGQDALPTKRPERNGPSNRPDGPDGPRFGPPPRIDVPRVEDMTQILKLTAEQQKKIKEILDSTQKQIDAALTAQQRTQLKQFRDQHRPPPRDFAEGDGPPDMEDEDHGRPVALVARDLGVTPEQFRAAFKKVHPAGAGQRPTEAQRQANRKVLSEALGVSPEKLDEVMDRYRPGGRGDNGPPMPPPDN